jgi:hypothetical protein
MEYGYTVFEKISLLRLLKACKHKIRFLTPRLFLLERFVLAGVEGMVQYSSRPVRKPAKSDSSQNLRETRCEKLSFKPSEWPWLLSCHYQRWAPLKITSPKITMRGQNPHGSKPKDLGVSDRKSISLDGDNTRYVGLKSQNGYGAAPNCFPSSLPPLDDPDRAIPPFISGLTVSLQNRPFTI